MKRRALSPLAAPSGPPADGLRSLPRRARLYVLAIVGLGALLLAYDVWSIRFDRPGLFIALPLPGGGSTMSLSYAITMTSLLVLDARQAVLIGMASAWSQCTFRIKARNPPHRTLFSIATVGAAVAVAGWIYEWVQQGQDVQRLGLFEVVQPLGLAVIAYFLVNTVLVAAAVALSQGEPLGRVWRRNFLWSAPSYFVAAGAAAVAAFVARQGSYSWGALIAVPLYLTYHSYRAFLARLEEEQAQVRQLSDVQLATIEALAQAIEVKDRTSQDHIRRIQVYAEGLGVALRLPDDDIRGLKTAALLHDIGNLAVPEHILTKPGALTDEEFQRVKIHPRVGADILQAVPFPYPVASLILAHHEHWDGTGYPYGLEGEEIPIGARVLAVVDCFTALLVDRPYRPARSRAEAVAVLLDHAGTKLDPALVRTFLDLLPSLEVEIEDRQVIREAHEALAPATPSATPRALDDIAVAHHEARMLYEIAQALGSSLQVDDTLSLIAQKLSGLLPFSCCALFLRQGTGNTADFRCRSTVGDGEDALTRLVVPDVEALASTVPLPVSGPDGDDLLQSVLASPLSVAGSTIGLLAVYHMAPGTYSNEHRRLLDRVAQQAGMAIHNALVFEETQEASLTDSLTGLPNRRAMQRRAARDLARAARQHHPLTVLLLDLDGLKYLNDTFGHETGDRALREAAAALRSGLRARDLCARFAGDEFVAVLWNCDAPQAEDRRHALQDVVDRVALEAAPGVFVSLAISAGAATFPADGSTLDELLLVADQRMYRDKAARKRSRPFQGGHDEQPPSSLPAAV
jgi:diguanylate cyclase (GGDEF)-like protein